MAMQFTTYCLAGNPRCQDRAAAEVAALPGVHLPLFHSCIELRQSLK